MTNILLFALIALSGVLLGFILLDFLMMRDPAMEELSNKMIEDARRERIEAEIKQDGDLFNCGCQVTNDDLQKTLSILGFELDQNQMHEVMRTVIFHIKR